MEIKVVQEKDTAYFVVGGDIDERGADTLTNHFRELTGKASFTKLVLDFKSVGYIGSSGIGAIILFYKNLAQSGGSVSIKNVSKEIYDLLSDLDVNKIISIHSA